MNNENVYGWDFAPKDTANKYIAACRRFVGDDLQFINFRRDSDYGKILEGGEYEVGRIHIDRIRREFGISAIIENISKYKESDIYGNPIIFNFEDIGNICPNTIHYIDATLSIKKMIGSNKIGKIVEIGGGFGNLCKTLSCDIDFSEYILVDLPEAVKLCEKYISNFSDLKDRVKYVACDKFEEYNFGTDIDIFIADSSLAECGRLTQKKYVSRLLKNSKFGYIVYNSLHIPESKFCYNDLIESISEFDIVEYSVGGNIVMNIERRQ